MRYGIFPKRRREENWPPVKKVLYATYMLTVGNIYVTYMSSQHVIFGQLMDVPYMQN